MDRKLLAVFALLAACLPLCPAFAAEPTDKLSLVTVQGTMKVTWSDTEERLQGELRPAHPRAGDTLTVTLDVASFYGSAFTGPLRVTLRRPDAGPEVHLVTREKGLWTTSFALTSEGLHTLDVAFRTTHDKVLHGTFEVNEAPIPTAVAWGVLAVVVAGALAYGINRVVRARSTNPEGVPPP